MNENSFMVLIHNAVGIMTPFLLAATGGLFTELAGMLNIALEGLMLIGAFFSVIFAAATGSIFLGILLGTLASILVSLIFGSISLYMKANIFICGMATNLLASGLTVVLAFQLYGNKGVIRFDNIPSLPVLHIPFIQDVPLLGALLSGHNILVYISWFILAIAAVVIYHTPFGLRIRGTGLGSPTITALGLNPTGYQLKAILISGLTCGLAGAVLSLNLAAFVPNITAGRGWIALVVIYLGNKTPLGILVASFIFGMADSVANFAQGAINIPADFFLAFPYIITVLAMVGYSIWKTHRVRVQQF